MTIMIDYEGVPGESTIQGFEKWIPVESCQFGVGRGISSAYGNSTREGSIVSVSEITVSKLTDGATIKLLEEALHGKLNKIVKIAFLRTGAGAAQEYLSFELNGTGLSGYSLSSGGDRPSESLSLNFDKFILKYNPIGDDFSGSPATVGWDLAKAVKV
ncbi:Hcp family type VI secretion system effector [Plastoroseomonas arctica]|uniref:Type VI secretion system tube protein Hcp n=1 Tax=Plastoroseomonas arctica TaxID=1509237 RepID=A0AAF1K210_9PROT|nr:type VI secretion system tube protein Hcp [Plastoroseomonas arctica]MBR0655413.1 type VI secretion system tube protein Hcp [Plastoroseomonas arctica]